MLFPKHIYLLTLNVYHMIDCAGSRPVLNSKHAILDKIVYNM